MRLIASIAALLVAAIIMGGNSQSVQAEEVQSSKASSKASPKMVVIEPGDSLSKIAKRHKTTYPRIYYANTKIAHPDKIYPNEKLRIPRPDEKLAKRPLPADAQLPVAEPASRAQQTQSQAYQPQPQWQPAQAATVAVANGSVWDKLAACESGGNWSINTGNGYYGGVQFSLATWRSVGGSGYPHQASKAEQINRAQILQARSGWGQWPACTAKLGLR